MKIYNFVVINMDTMETIEEESYEYQGPVAKCEEEVSDFGEFFSEDIPQAVQDPLAPENLSLTLGATGLLAGGGLFGVASEGDLAAIALGGIAGGAVGTGVGKLGEFFLRPDEIDIPVPPTPSSGASTAEINEYNLAVENFQLLQQGLRKEPNPEGGFFIREIPDAELDIAIGSRGAIQLRLNRNIRLHSSQRTEAALLGNLPVSPGFERDAAKRREQIILGLQRGAGVTSTAGIQQLGREQEGTDITREQIRRGEITAGFGRQLSQEQFESQRIAQVLGGFQQGRVGAAQLGLQQQGLQNQLLIARLQNKYKLTPGQQIAQTAIGGAAPGATQFLLQ